MLKKKEYESKLAEIKLLTINQQIELLQLALEASNKFDVISGKLNILVRRELSFTIDDEKYTELLEKASKRGSQFVQRMKDLVEEHKHEL